MKYEIRMQSVKSKHIVLKKIYHFVKPAGCTYAPLREERGWGEAIKAGKGFD
jgi:hypothetical protein